MRSLSGAVTHAKQLPPRPTIKESDIEESFLKGSGPGGQKIVRSFGTTSSAKKADMVFLARVEQDFFSSPAQALPNRYCRQKSSDTLKNPKSKYRAKATCREIGVYGQGFREQSGVED